MNREILNKLNMIKNEFDQFFGYDPKAQSKAEEFIQSLKVAILVDLHQCLRTELKMIPSQIGHTNPIVHQLLDNPRMYQYTLSPDMLDALKEYSSESPAHALRGISLSALSSFFELLYPIDGVTVGVEMSEKERDAYYIRFYYHPATLMSELPKVIAQYEEEVRRDEMYTMIKSIYDKLA